MTVAITVYIVWLLPDSLLRLLLWVFTHTVYAHPRGRTREHPGARRRAFRLEPHVAGGWAAAHRLEPDRPIRFLSLQATFTTIRS